MGKSNTGGLRVVKNKDDRNAGRGAFITLKNEGDKFVAYALFTPDGEAKDNAGWLEYLEHYTKATGYCPCAGDDCPLCAAGDTPSTRAKTLWLVVPKDDADVEDGKLGIFALNYYMIEEFADLFGDDEPVKGQLFRITRKAGNGQYTIRPKKKKLKAAEIKAALKGAPDLRELAMKQQAKVFEDLDLGAAMTEEDDDEDETTTDKKKSSKSGDKKSDKGKKGSKAKKGEPEEEEPEDLEPGEFDPEEDDEFEGTVTINKVNKSKNGFTVETEDGTEFAVFGYVDGDAAVDVTDFSKGDKVEIAAKKDEDDEFMLSSCEAADAEAEDDETEKEDDDESEYPDEIDGLECEAIGLGVDDDGDEIADVLRVKLPDGIEMNLWFYEDGEDSEGVAWSDIDLDDFEDKKVTVWAKREEDDEGDNITAIRYPEVVKKGGKGKAKAGGKSGGKKGGKKK